jgi:hypothetical protein
MSAISDLQADRVAALCDELRLAGVAESFAALATRAVATEQRFVDFLEQALIAERDCRRARSAATLVRTAGFPAIKTLDDDYKFATTAPRRQIEQLAGPGFVADAVVPEQLHEIAPFAIGLERMSTRWLTHESKRSRRRAGPGRGPPAPAAPACSCRVAYP